MTTQKNLQTFTDKITTLFKVPAVKVEVTNSSGKGLACYRTERIVGGRINFPKCITIFNWNEIKDHPAEVGYRLTHEIAHHISNCKYNTLKHTNKHGDLADDLMLFANQNKDYYKLLTY